MSHGEQSLAPGTDPHSSDVDVYSYSGSIRGAGGNFDLAPLYHDALYALTDRSEATVGPVLWPLPSTGPSTKYRFTQSMEGAEPGTGNYVTDKDSATITCIEP
ncbi:MAG TPA: hypothetical protein VGK20_17770 [Candidatus Binatia bacterium]